MEDIKETKKAPAKKAPAKKTPNVITKIDPKTGTLKVVEKKTTKKKDDKKTTKDTKDTKKKATKSTTKSTTKKATKSTTKKAPTTKTPKKVTTPKPKKEEPVVVETVTPVEEPVITQEPVVTEEVVTTPVEVAPKVEVDNTPKRRGRKPSENPLPKVSSKELTIEPPKREPKVEKKKEKEVPKEPEVIVRPTPKKVKVLTKEEKVVYKKLQEAFNYVANLTMVVEEKTMDTKAIPDLTVGELHVIEMVDNYNNKPMTLIANKLKVTVGSLTICINRLVQKGYLLRTRHEMDHRIILVSTTPKGKKVLKTHDKFHEDILGLVLEGITLQQAMKVMTQFALVLENYYDPKTIVTATKKEGSKK